VATEDTRKAISASMAKIPSVKVVHNELIVAGNSSLVSRSGDAVVTANVKSRMIGNKHFSSNHIKVVTEGGTVYLMGLVSKEEADAAVEVARNTSGVGKVVRVFETIEAPKS
jgi:osmotically-inducible protein OsmY